MGPKDLQRSRKGPRKQPISGYKSHLLTCSVCEKNVLNAMFVTYVFPCKTYTSFLLKQNVTSPERFHFRHSKECEGKYPRLSQEPLLDLALHCLFELHSLPSYPFIPLLALSSSLFSRASKEPWLLQYFLQTTSNSNGTHLQDGSLQRYQLLCLSKPL